MCACVPIDHACSASLLPGPGDMDLQQPSLYWAARFSNPSVENTLDSDPMPLLGQIVREQQGPAALQGPGCWELRVVKRLAEPMAVPARAQSWQYPSKMSRAGPEAVTRFRHCPVIIRQVHSDEVGLRSGQEGSLWVSVLAWINGAHGQAETVQKAAMSMRSHISIYPPESDVLGRPGTLTKLQSSKV